MDTYHSYIVFKVVILIVTQYVRGKWKQWKWKVETENGKWKSKTEAVKA